MAKPDTHFLFNLSGVGLLITRHRDRGPSYGLTLSSSEIGPEGLKELLAGESVDESLYLSRDEMKMLGHAILSLVED